MKNIIKTDNYLLIVSDEEIKEGDWFYNRILTQSIRAVGVWSDKIDNLNSNLETFKIISHLPLNNSPILEGVDLLPPLEDEVEKLAQKYVEDEVKPDIEPRGYNQDLRIGIYGGSVTGFIDGYNKAKEKYAQLIEKQISDFTHDLKESTSNYIKQNCEGALFGLKRLKQSLQQPKYPIGFESEEYQELCLNCEWQHDSCPNAEDCLKPKPKTTTNSQGQTVLEGKYIYE